MSLLEEIKKLRELEQQTIKDRVEHWPIYQYRAAKLAPDMLRVLECFQKGDEDLLVEYIYQFTEEYGVDGVVFSDTAFGKFMKRMQKAASLMEQEEREA